MLDGLNEGTAQEEVRDVLLQSMDSDWKGTVGILLSDRPTHWDRVFKQGKWLEPPPVVIEVGPFSDVELDRLLAKHGKVRVDFSSKVLEIIRWPRWFAVA